MQLRLFNRYICRCIACGHAPSVEEARAYALYIQKFC